MLPSSRATSVADIRRLYVDWPRLQRSRRSAAAYRALDSSRRTRGVMVAGAYLSLLFHPSEVRNGEKLFINNKMSSPQPWIPPWNSFCSVSVLCVVTNRTRQPSVLEHPGFLFSPKSVSIDSDLCCRLLSIFTLSLRRAGAIDSSRRTRHGRAVVRPRTYSGGGTVNAPRMAEIRVSITVRRTAVL
jgi:hypothetical protein